MNFEREREREREREVLGDLLREVMSCGRKVLSFRCTLNKGEGGSKKNREP